MTQLSRIIGVTRKIHVATILGIREEDFQWRIFAPYQKLGIAGVWYLAISDSELYFVAPCSIPGLQKRVIGLAELSMYQNMTQIQNLPDTFFGVKIIPSSNWNLVPQGLIQTLEKELHHYSNSRSVMHRIVLTGMMRTILNNDRIGHRLPIDKISTLSVSQRKPNG